MKMRKKRLKFAESKTRVWLHLPNGVAISWHRGDRNWKKKLVALLGYWS